MDQNPTFGNNSYSEQPSEVRQEPSFHYQMVDMKARKIATLIKFSKLPYQLEEVTETESRPYVLRTNQGELFHEYEIIGFIINDNLTRGLRASELNELVDDRPTLWVDIFSLSKINQRLFELRKKLLPMLQEFYRYILGHETCKKSKYESLNNKIRKEILKIDQEIGEHNEIYGAEYSFINIIIACQLFLGYKFVFEEKFRKSKGRIFNKCEKIYKTAEFEEIYGKVVPCVRECLPAEFEEEIEVEAKKEDAIQVELAKLVEPWANVSGNQMRNELLYNFFRNTLKGKESKSSYFPYFWLMYDSLLCTLVELSLEPGDNHPDLEKSLDIGCQELGKIVKANIDYGFLGLYINQKDRKPRIQGLLCLGDHSFQQFSTQLSKTQILKRFKASKIDTHSEEQRHKVQMLWQYQTQGLNFEGIKVSLMRQF